MELLQYSNILSENEFHEQAEFLQTTEWRFLNQSDPSGQTAKFWIKDLNNNSFYTKYLFSIIEELLQKENINVELLRVYANGQTTGLPGNFHQDAEDEEHYTFLVYFNHSWNADWGGHTIIKSEETQEFLSFLPVPNSGLFFKGNLWHAGLDPNRHCNTLRVSVAYKLKLTEGKDNDKSI